MAKINVIVLMGGKSSEHEISVLSGREVATHLNPKKYNVFPIVISKDGKNWQLTDKNSLLKLENIINLKNTPKEIALSSRKVFKSVPSEIQNQNTIAFIAMHGKFGEDGTVQGMMDLMGFKYTGSGVLASSIGMDKEMFRKVLKSANIQIPKYFVMNKKDKIKNLFDYPVFVKPVNGGSSVASNIANNFAEFEKATKEALSCDDRVLVDEYIKGKEITCAVLGNDAPIALPLIEIKPLKGKFFDYESKYTESGSEEIVPAKISSTLTKKIQSITIQVYKLIGLKGFGRVDFLLKDDKYPVVLEVNTIPGLTPMSLLPKAAKAYGLSYSQLLDKIVEYARKES